MIKFLTEEEANRRLLFVDNLKYIMRTKKLSAVKVASRMGICQTTVYDYTKGKQFPDDVRMNALADALGCSIDDLFDDSYLPWVFGPEGIIDKEKYKELL